MTTTSRTCFRYSSPIDCHQGTFFEFLTSQYPDPDPKIRFFCESNCARWASRAGLFLKPGCRINTAAHVSLALSAATADPCEQRSVPEVGTHVLCVRPRPGTLCKRDKDSIFRSSEYRLPSAQCALCTGRYGTFADTRNR